MKKLLILLSVFIFQLNAKAQTPTHIDNLTGAKYVFVGSLTMAPTNTSNSQRIVVKIYGGSWFQTSNAETSFYISNRDGLNIRQVSLGGSVKGYLSLKAYQNGSNVNLYIVPNSAQYTSFAVSSYSFGFSLTPQFVTITSQSTTPAGTDITSSAPIMAVFTTNGSGQIGIGTDSPAEALSVNGKIRSKEVKVENANWPDYVFSRDYHLSPLEETEKHIKEKGHLPGIPSATEVKENGIALGDMNAKLLEKIEELTLHLIQKDKEIAKERLVNQRQEQRIKKLELARYKN